MPEFELSPQAPVITAYARLANTQVRRVLMGLHTGATYTMIPWDIAEVLGYEPAISRRKVDIITASGVEKAPLITLSSISALGKEAKNVDCVVHDLPQASRVEGLLGLSFLRNFTVLLDFRRGLLRID